MREGNIIPDQGQETVKGISKCGNEPQERTDHDS
jgi:hypothetical protein